MTPRAKQKYSAEFKDNAVKRATESGNVAETARELGIKENTLYNWVYQYSRVPKPDKAARTDEHLYDELKQLRKEVARLKEERDILKKAAAYFAKEIRFRPRGFKIRARIIVSPCCVPCCQSPAVRTTRGQNRCKHIKRSKMRN